MSVKPMFSSEKLWKGVFLMPMIEKYKEIDNNLRFLQFSELN